MVTDGKSTTPNKTDEEAHRVRDDGIALTAVGIKGKIHSLFSVTFMTILSDINNKYSRKSIN